MYKIFFYFLLYYNSLLFIQIPMNYYKYLKKITYIFRFFNTLHKRFRSGPGNCSQIWNELFLKFKKKIWKHNFGRYKLLYLCLIWWEDNLYTLRGFIFIFVVVLNALNSILLVILLIRKIIPIQICQNFLKFLEH